MVHYVLVFVDWDSARRIYRPHSPKKPTRTIELVFEKLYRVVEEHLNALYKHKTYRVRWRIYHGWHTGKTKTQDRNDFESFISDMKATCIKNVSFGNDFQFGNELMCLSKRNVLYDTLRSQYGKIFVQKMVDTSLTCDLLHCVRHNESNINIIIADDDDVFPAAVTAEAWGSNVSILTRRENINRHLCTTGLVYSMGD